MWNPQSVDPWRARELVGSLIPATSSKVGAVKTSNKCDGTLALRLCAFGSFFLYPLRIYEATTVHAGAGAGAYSIPGLALGHLAFT
jgi:hypothetical protein